MPTIDDRTTNLSLAKPNVANTLQADVARLREALDAIDAELVALDNSNIAAGAEIAVSKLADGIARQLLQTDAAGTGVEWTSNVDLPGTLDVTGAATFDSAVTVPLGTAGAPALRPVGSSTTGIFYPDTSTVAVSTGGSERLRIGSTGAVAIGSTITAGGGSGSTLRWANNMTGAIATRAIFGTPTIQSDVTSSATLYETSPSTAAAAFTVASLFHYAASQGTIGASSAISNQYGFIANGSLIGATNNFGFYGNIPAATGRWNFYAAGTAPNYFAGATQTALGSAAAPSLTPIGGTDTGIFYPDTSTVAVSTGGTERWRATSAGNLKIGGTANRATTEGTAQLVLFNGTAPVGTLSNGVSLYSASGECRVMDAAGNSTLLSPHDRETNEWIYDSTDTTTGKRLRIDMEKMMKFLDNHFGLGFVQETFGDPA